MDTPRQDNLKGPEAFLALFTPNNRTIFHFILSLIPNWNDAQDVMQETSRVLWEKFDTSFEPGTDFLAWALTVARYQAMDFCKRRRRNVSLQDEVAEVFLADCQHQQDHASDRISALKQCLAELNAPDRRHLQQRFKDSLPPKRLAESLGISVKRIYRNEARIIGLLMRCIRRRLFEEGALG